ncbi:hypothetical protein E2C01_081007 [Portunus trituberculatus]|uniref:Uncharacterized protein n=1 Tax=Portunus trituberculatus TaxID=210409 RepID=A0A5B7INQ1_PORTR|nr:hypothetical protein [Portunus trituberculatus]
MPPPSPLPHHACSLVLPSHPLVFPLPGHRRYSPISPITATRSTLTPHPHFSRHKSFYAYISTSPPPPDPFLHHPLHTRSSPPTPTKPIPSCPALPLHLSPSFPFPLTCPFPPPGSGQPEPRVRHEKWMSNKRVI